VCLSKLYRESLRTAPSKNANPVPHRARVDGSGTTSTTLTRLESSVCAVSHSRGAQNGYKGENEKEEAGCHNPGD
jgi:hypothetical protein